MSSTFATNSAANSAVSYLHRNSEWQSSSISKLSSGSRIVKASDDAASLAVGTKLKADVTALKQASTNASQASSLLQVADGALSRISDTLMRMKSLATQARSDALTNTERGYLNQEFSEMQAQLDYISSSTKFNDTAVISGGLGTTNSAEAGFSATAALDLKANSAGTYEIVKGAAAGTIQVNETVSGESQTVALDAGVASSTDYTGTVRFGALGVTLDFENFDMQNDALAGGGTDDVTVVGGAAIFQVGVTAGAANDDVSVNIAQTDSTTLGVDADNINTIAAAEPPAPTSTPPSRPSTRSARRWARRCRGWKRSTTTWRRPPRTSTRRGQP